MSQEVQGKVGTCGTWDFGWHKYGHPGMSQEVQGKVGTWDLVDPICE